MLDPQSNDGPAVAWQAVVERVFGGAEREFLRAVMTTAPPAYAIPVAGAQQ